MLSILWRILLQARTVDPEETSTAREQHGNNTLLGIFYAIRATIPQEEGCTQEQRTCWKRFPPRSYEGTPELLETLWMDRIYFTRVQQHTRKWGAAFNRKAMNRDRKVFRMRNRTNTERETRTLKVNAAPRNKRAHPQLTTPHGRWQQMTSLFRSQIYVCNMRRRVAKETSLKYLKQI
jgi:hypothetical protein